MGGVLAGSASCATFLVLCSLDKEEYKDYQPHHQDNVAQDYWHNVLRVSLHLGPHKIQPFSPAQDNRCSRSQRRWLCVGTMECRQLWLHVDPTAREKTCAFLLLLLLLHGEQKVQQLTLGQAVSQRIPSPRHVVSLRSFSVMMTSSSHA